MTFILQFCLQVNNHCLKCLHVSLWTYLHWSQCLRQRQRTVTDKKNHINSCEYLWQKWKEQAHWSWNQIWGFWRKDQHQLVNFIGLKNVFFLLVTFIGICYDLSGVFVQYPSSKKKNKCMNDFMHKVLLLLYCSSIFSLLHSHYQGGQSRSGNQIQPILLASYFWSIPEIRHKHTGTRSVWTL